MFGGQDSRYRDLHSSASRLSTSHSAETPFADISFSSTDNQIAKWEFPLNKGFPLKLGPVKVKNTMRLISDSRTIWDGARHKRTKWQQIPSSTDNGSMKFLALLALVGVAAAIPQVSSHFFECGLRMEERKRLLIPFKSNLNDRNVSRVFKFNQNLLFQDSAWLRIHGKDRQRKFHLDFLLLSCYFIRS